MKKYLIALTALGLLGLVSVVMFLPWRPSHHPDYYVSQAVISPFPTTLRHVKTIYLFEPSMGEGACLAAYSITPDDFTRLFQARPWVDGLITENSEVEQHFRAAWPDAAPQFKAYHLTNGDRRRVEMAVSPDHTKIIFLIRL